MFTLQERANMIKGVTLTEDVTFIEKIDASLKNYAGRFKKGDLLRQGIPMVDTFDPSDGQLNEWCNRVLDGKAMTQRMVSSIISDPGFEANGIGSSDEVIDAACFWSIAAYAAKM
jgi:hypothetical protein